MSHREPFLIRVPLHLYLFFAVLLIWPVSQNTGRSILAGVFALLSMIIILLKPKKFYYSVWASVASGVSIVTGAFFCLYGFLLGNPGAAFSLLIYVMWPVFYILFATQISHVRTAQVIHRIIVGCTIFLGVFVANFLLIDQGKIPDNLLNRIDLGQAINYLDGITQMRFYPISTMIFAVPYLVCYLIASAGNSKRKDWLWSLIALIAGVFIMIFSGRRALLLNTLIAPALVLLVIGFLRGQAQLKRNALLVVLIGFIVIPSIFLASSLISPNHPLSQVIAQFIENNLTRADEGNTLRVQQSAALLDGWRDSPLLGHGLGAVAQIVRSEDRPWQYELQYHVTLFDTGLLGFIGYAFCIASLFYFGFRALRFGNTALVNYVLSACVGLLSFLIANASNPYFQAFGHLYAIFLPVGLINLSLRRQEAKEKTEGKEASAPFNLPTDPKRPVAAD